MAKKESCKKQYIVTEEGGNGKPTVLTRWTAKEARELLNKHLMGRKLPTLK